MAVEMWVSQNSREALGSRRKLDGCQERLSKSVDRYMVTAVSCQTFVCDEMPSSRFPFRAGAVFLQHEGCHWPSLQGAPSPKSPLWSGASAQKRDCCLALSRNSVFQLPSLILSSLSKPQLAFSALGNGDTGSVEAPPPKKKE
uniref:Uncharacterized protein n=1 Tax=Micrurus paraensis TaxID=1970185 RepID=A0A2D4KLU8_9SAUR